MGKASSQSQLKLDSCFDPSMTVSCAASALAQRTLICKMEAYSHRYCTPALSMKHKPTSLSVGTAKLFCEAIHYFARSGSKACKTIALVGVISVIGHLLTCFSDEKLVVKAGCGALYFLAVDGSASIKDMLRTPDIISLLRRASMHLRAWGKTDYAADALQKMRVTLHVPV